MLTQILARKNQAHAFRQRHLSGNRNCCSLAAVLGRGKRFFGILAFALIMFSGGMPAQAETWVVTTGADSGAGSLRQAIGLASSGDNITFDDDYTILLSSGLSISKNLNIRGGEHSVTVDGQHTAQVFAVNSGVTFNLDGITVANGNHDEGNEYGFGGGIQNLSGTINVNNCTFIGNFSAYRGGAIYSEFGSATITNSTFSGNTAAQIGGAVSLHLGSATIINCTFSGNSAQYAGGLQASNLSPAVYNTLLAGNPGGNCTQVNSTGWNNLTDEACGSGFNISSSILLGALGDYGGPTKTFALLPGSAAIDAGDNETCEQIDQRGNARPLGDACDIGAFESRGFSIAIMDGDNQSAPVSGDFAQPLTVSVSSTFGEPVDGGSVTYTGPPAGAGISPIKGAAVIGAIASGIARFSARANDIDGLYTVTAGAAGAQPTMIFNLQNTPATDLVLTQSSSSETIQPGEEITFTLQLVNNGPIAAKSVVVQDTIPDNASFVSAAVVSGSGWTMTAPAAGGAGAVEFSKAEMADNETATFQVTVIMRADADPGSSLTNTAVVQSETDEINQETNTSVLTVADICELSVFPAQISKMLSGGTAQRTRVVASASDPMLVLKLLGAAIPVQPFLIIARPGMVVTFKEKPVWDTDSFKTLLNIKLGRRALLALVYVNLFTAQAGAHTVSLGECTGDVYLEDMQL